MIEEPPRESLGLLWLPNYEIRINLLNTRNTVYCESFVKCQDFLFGDSANELFELDALNLEERSRSFPYTLHGMKAVTNMAAMRSL